MANYQFDHKKILTKLLPPFLRKPRIIAFLYALLKPLLHVYDQLLLERIQFIIDSRENSQQMLLENMLNNSFDNAQRRIVVVTPDAPQLRLDAYLQEEGQPITPAYLQEEGQPVTPAYSLEDISLHRFNIELPTSLQPSETAIRALLNKYVIATKIYTLIWKS